MKWGRQDDTLLRRYLLGKLRKGKADRLERRLLEDDKLFELAEAVEADLLDAADRGDLAPAERERVLQRLASSPQGRERLALARSLNTVADEQPVVVPLPRTPVFSLPAIRWVALAASLLIVTGLGLVAWQYGPQARDMITRILFPPSEPIGHTPPVKPETSPPGQQDKETQKPGEPQQPQRQAPPPQPPAPPDVLALTLMRLRGSEEEVAKLQQLHLSPGSHTAEFRITMVDIDAKSFDVAIYRAEKPVWGPSALEPAQRKGGSSLLLVDVPAEILSTGRYEIAITPESESKMSKKFEVVQPNR